LLAKEAPFGAKLLKRGNEGIETNPALGIELQFIKPRLMAKSMGDGFANFAERGSTGHGIETYPG
jgi:hypothetical protein